MTFPASAKVTRPQPARARARTRLYKRLDHSRTYPVVWVVGPPGAGKTTLVSNYLDTRGIKGIWYQVDTSDEDPATFFHYMGIAAHHAAPRYRKPLPIFTPAHLPGLAVFTRRYFEALFGRLKTPAVVVLDNYHEVLADSNFHMIMAEAAAALPKGVWLLIVSHSEPPPTFARLRANGALVLLDNAELKLTLDESSAIARLRDKRKLDPSVLERLHERTAGWTAGLVLLLGQPDIEAPWPTGENKHQVLFDYFATEIFHKLDTTTQSVLCQAALFPKASVDRVRALTGKPEAGTILADLYRRNYFVIKHGHDEVYQFHPLFHDFLLHRAREVFPPILLNSLRTQAGALLEAAGDIEAAAELWRMASDWSALGAHVLRHAPAFAAQGRFQTLEIWLRALPGEALDRTPWLRYWFGVCRMQTDLAEAQGHFELAYTGFARADEAMGLYASWSGVVGCIYMMWRDFTSLTSWLEALEDLRRRHPQWPSAEIELRVVTGAVVGYSGHRPDHPNLRSWLAHAQRLIDTLTNDVQRIQLAIHMVLVLYWLGESRQAALIVKSIEHTSKNIKNAPITEAWWHAISMVNCWQRLAPRASLQKLDQALASANVSGVHVMDNFLYAHAVYAALAIDDLPATETFLQAIGASLPPHSTLGLAHYWSLHALADLHAGRFAAAIDHGRQALALGQAAAVPFGEANCHLGLAVALYETGEREVAQEHLRAVRAIGVGMDSRQIEYWCCALEAHIAFEDEDTVAGRQSLARALALSREMDGAPMYWWPQTRVAQLYAQALEHDIETDHVRDLIRRLGLVPVASATVPESWPFPLKIYTLGRFSVLIHGKPLIFAGKAQKKPLELLKGLIAFGGREVREDKLACALWPLAENAPQALATTVHRLRKLIGEDAVERSEGCLTLSPRHCWVDIWAFERQMTHIDQACQERRLVEIVLQIERIFARYGSGFLAAESDARWAMTARERLRSKLLRQIETVADVLIVAQQHDAAIGCYRKALEIDPLAEALYCGLMQCYATTGRHAEALSIYERCREILNEQLGVKPSPRTEALARQFKAN